MSWKNPTPGISRIDQPEKRTHGFFVRVTRNGKIHSAFFTDLKHGGKARALAAAQRHRRRLLDKLGLPRQKQRRFWAELRRRQGSSNVVGVQKVVSRRGEKPVIYWKATWSPEPYVVRRKLFSVAKYGSRKAKKMAVAARRAGVAKMK